jgi:CRISPR/Cas system-associated endonuclease Cas1
MTVLYLTEPGNTLAASSRTLVVRQGTEERAQVPAVGLERVVVLAPSNLTSAAVSLCAREDVELVVVAHGARVMSRLGASNAGLALRAGQYRRAADEAFCLAFARTVVAGKMRNQRRVLARSPCSSASWGGRSSGSCGTHSWRVLIRRGMPWRSTASVEGCGGRVRRLGVTPPDPDPQYLIL